ncbi:hypothetical protein NWF24_22655 [Variovorax paradoxus]|uniref:hypothetical protein n=1 Tax=Variovorax paradoxus TaxID=34073 RepID=UPI0021AC08E9|nr:hypothetical protein [Variovorax paradoxus]UVH55630.1 hypothetical protein NWF24_22655 [Variovorax paradoxus]
MSSKTVRTVAHVFVPFSSPSTTGLWMCRQYHDCAMRLEGKGVKICTMDMTFGPNTYTVLPTPAGFAGASAANYRYMRGLISGTYARSNELSGVDGALTAFDQVPSRANWLTLTLRMQTWLTAKAGRYNVGTGVINSVRGASVTNLKAQIDAYRQFLLDRDTLMANVANQLDLLNWRTRTICAELYDDANNAAFGLYAPHIAVLEEEGILSSGFVRAFRPGHTTIADWDNAGASELGRLNAWPTLQGVARFRINNWRAWHPALADPRKGLFCHSSAALAVHCIVTHRIALQGALSCPIRSIDVYHQRGNAGEITHWWVAINRPDNIALGTAPHGTLTTMADFDRLEMMGGFVIDIWGALWLAQQNNPGTWVGSAAAVAENAVRLAPFITLNGVNTLTHYSRLVF